MSKLSNPGYRDYSDNPEFCPSTDLNSSELSFPTDFFYAVKDSWVQELGFQLAFLYSMVISLSTKAGYCYMKDQTFANRMGMSLRTIERWVNQLEEKGFIYRNTFQSRQGKKRHIVPKPHFLDYWSTFLNRPCVPDEVKKDYLKRMFACQPTEKLPPLIEKASNMNRQMEPPNGPPDKNGGSYVPDKNGGSLLLRNSNSKEQQQTDGGAKNVVVVSLERLIKKELANLGISGSRADMALQYYHQNKEMVDKKKNPLGWIIKGAQQGWIVDMVTKTNHTAAPPPIPKSSSPPPQKFLSPIEASQVQEVVNKFKDLVQQDHINIETTPEGFHWKASNTRGKFFHPYQKPGGLHLLKTLASNMNQEVALDFMGKTLKEEAYANL